MNTTIARADLPVALADLAERLEQKQYFLDPQLSRLVRLALTTRKGINGARLVGPQGSGKTKLTELIAGVLGYEYCYLQATRGMTEAELFFGIMPDDTTQSGFARFEGILLRAAEASLTHPVVLCLDEWDKTRSQADGMLLDFLQTGRLSHPAVNRQANTDNLIVFVCTNMERELSEPLQRRLPTIDLGHPKVSIMHRILSNECPQSPYIQHAVKVYAQTIEAGLSKPATAQELVQLLQALEQTENVSGATLEEFDGLLDLFVLKTESDRIRFRTWCAADANKQQTLKDLAIKLDGAKAAQTVYAVKDEAAYDPVSLHNANEISRAPALLPKQLCVHSYTEKAHINSKTRSATFEHQQVAIANAHVPHLLKNADAWGYVEDSKGGTAITYESLDGLEGLLRIENLVLTVGTKATIAYKLYHPIKGREFSIGSIAKRAMGLNSFTPKLAIGHGAISINGVKEQTYRYWFRAQPTVFEVIVQFQATPNFNKILLRNILNHLLGETFMTWYMGGQTTTEDTKLWSVQNSYGMGRPTWHGLYAIIWSQIPADRREELIRRNNARITQIRQIHDSITHS